MSSSPNFNICNLNLLNLKLLGQGFFGKVYKYGNDKVIKSVDISNRPKYMQIVVKKMLINELNALSKAKGVIKKRVTNGLAELDRFDKCHVVENNGRDKGGLGIRMLMQYYPLKFSDMMSGADEKDWLNFMFHLWYNIYVIHHVMGFAHNDLDLNNVMFKKVGKGYYKYVMGKDVFIVETVGNEGYIPVIIDFGNAVKLNNVSVKERKRLIDRDYSFFFSLDGDKNVNSNRDGMDYLYRREDLKEAIYQHFTVQQIIDTLGRESDTVKQAFVKVKKRYRKLGGQKFMKKVKNELCSVIGNEIALYQKFDDGLNMIEKVKRPNGVVRSFFTKLNNGSWNNEDKNNKKLLAEFKI